MFGYALRSVKVMLKYAPVPTVIKMFDGLIKSAAIPASLYFTQRLVNDIEPFVQGQTAFTSILLWTCLLVATGLFSSSMNFLNGIQYINLLRSLNRGFTKDMITKYQRIDYACFEDREVQDTLTRMGAVPQERVLWVFLNVVGVFSWSITFVGLALFFSQLGIWFPLVLLAIMVSMVWLTFKAIDTMNTMFNRQTEEERKMSYLSGLLSNKASLFELKIFGAIDYIRAIWQIKTKKVLNERLQTTIKVQRYNAVSVACLLIFVGLMTFTLIRKVTQNEISVGLFVSLIGSVGGVLGSVDNLSVIFSNVSQNYLQMKHYTTFINLPEIKNIPGERKIESPHIIFENVHFTYPKTEREILKGISFEIKPQEKIALVGRNGAGKSTVIKLLCRLYSPDKGRILINGQDIRNLSQAQLRGVFSVVFQDYMSYYVTLRENVAFGEIEKLHDDTAVRTALKQGLADGISDNLDINLGKIDEDGVDLSGGQWQRIAVARACIADSAFVILDEPTASLDPVAESEMYRTFAEVLKNKGCIMISHRLASAKMADKIVVVEDGVARETGSHAELLAGNNLYAQMWAAQSTWYRTGVEDE